MTQPLVLSNSLWMDGPMNGVDPDQVENEAGAMWRALYKLEKTFSENPNPLKMAQKVHCTCTCTSTCRYVVSVIII